MQTFLHFSRFVIARHWTAAGLFLLGLVAAVLWFKPFTAAFRADTFEQASTVFSAATLLVAVFIWFGEAREDWEETLPKRLKVVFLLHGSPVLISEGATLLAEADLRALAQQLGRQLNGGRDLAFSLRCSAPGPRIQHAGGPVERLYEVQIRLTDPPSRLVELAARNPAAPVHGIRRVESDAGPKDEDLDLGPRAAAAIRSAAGPCAAQPVAPPKAGS